MAVNTLRIHASSAASQAVLMARRLKMALVVKPTEDSSRISC
jgi:hypothetical protein